VPDDAVDERAALSGLLAAPNLQVRPVDAECIGQGGDDLQNVDQLLGRPARGGLKELVDLPTSLARSSSCRSAGVARWKLPVWPVARMRSGMWSRTSFIAAASCWSCRARTT
jgi:hypothetical protein